VRIVLANPSKMNDRQSDLTSYPNLGILSIIAYARQYYPDIEYVYLESLDADKYGEEIKKLNPDIFCVSFATFMHSQSYFTINEVRKSLPYVPIICGGAHPTGQPDEVLTLSKADIAVIGEGEKTFLELIRYYRKDGYLKLADINGIAFRSDDGSIVQTKSREFMDINEIPMMAWDLVDLKKYSGAHISRMKYSTCILPSRGCPYDCVFCSNPVWKSSKPWLRLRNPKLVADEVKWLYDQGIRELYIRSDELNANKQWTLDFCREIQTLNLEDMKFQCNLRADHVDDELAEALKSIGLWLVYLGIESMNQRVIDGIQKYIDVNAIEKICTILQRNKIKVYGFVMLYQVWEENGELQHETTAEVDYTIAEMWRLIWNNKINYMSWQFATPLPGSQLWDIAHKHSIIKNNSAGFWEVSVNIPNTENRDMIRQRTIGFLIQAYCGLRSGNLNWIMWRRYKNKILYILESAYKLIRDHINKKYLINGKICDR